MTVVAGESVDEQLRVKTEVLLGSTCNEITDGAPVKKYTRFIYILHVFIVCQASLLAVRYIPMCRY